MTFTRYLELWATCATIPATVCMQKSHTMGKQLFRNLIALLMALLSLAAQAQDARQISTSGQVRWHYLAGSTIELSAYSCGIAGRFPFGVVGAG